MKKNYLKLHKGKFNISIWSVLKLRKNDRIPSNIILKVVLKMILIHENSFR